MTDHENELREATPNTKASPMFRVGEPASRDGTDIVFISDVHWSETRGWVYCIQYTQENVCSLHKWVGGGSSCWWGEQDFKPLTGTRRLVAELFRQLREKARLEHEIKGCESVLLAHQISLKAIGVSVGCDPH